MRLGIGAVSLMVVLAVGALVANASIAAAPSKSPSQVTVTYGDKGSTVDLHVGERLRVVLDSTYWGINPSSNPGDLVQLGRVVIVPKLRGCVPGEGCGTVTALYRAVAPGTVSLSASRVSCGEVLRCTNGNGSFQITVRIK